MFLLKVLHLTLIFLISGILPVFWGSRDLWGSTFTLDKETVFGIYYKLSQKEINETDVEDLYFESGRPAFTLYKPSEMFMRHSLRKLMVEINEKIKDYDENSLFRQRLTCVLTSQKDKRNSHEVIFKGRGLPQPTPYIGSEISGRGRRAVKRLLRYLASRRSDLGQGEEWDVTLYLRPEKIDYRFQKRYIAHEDIILPIRSVIFQPVKIEAFDKTIMIEE